VIPSVRTGRMESQSRPQNQGVFRTLHVPPETVVWLLLISGGRFVPEEEIFVAMKILQMDND
ncbi:hypothetical protein, partial [Gluconobacter kondonii]|uniref:hypothetical protein n=1 Tax=Gluconobacter kondonii TaxID=941463 RepID=UPI001B8D6EA5